MAQEMTYKTCFCPRAITIVKVTISSNTFSTNLKFEIDGCNEAQLFICQMCKQIILTHHNDLRTSNVGDATRIFYTFV